MAIHQFERRAAESRAADIVSRTQQVLRDKVEAKGFRWTEEGGDEDRHGIDVWCLLPNRTEVGVDVKANKWGEVRIEYVSQVGSGAIGWTVDDTKRSDYILNLWPGRFWLIDFPSLKAVAKLHRELYMEHYALKAASSTSNTGEWRTLFVPVPVGILLSHIYGTPERPATVMGLPLTAPRECPSCHQRHPVGTTCDGGWGPF
jgi:hypothetical protein